MLKCTVLGLFRIDHDLPSAGQHENTVISGARHVMNPIWSPIDCVKNLPSVGQYGKDHRQYVPALTSHSVNKSIYYFTIIWFANIFNNGVGCPVLQLRDFLCLDGVNSSFLLYFNFSAHKQCNILPVATECYLSSAIALLPCSGILYYISFCRHFCRL